MGREDIPFEKRGDLTHDEKEAIALYFEYGDFLNDYLRNLKLFRKVMDLL